MGDKFEEKGKGKEMKGESRGKDGNAPEVLKISVVDKVSTDVTSNMASIPADVKDFEKEYVYTVDMPGMKKEEINIQIGKVLTIFFERKRPETEKGVKYLRKDLRMGKFMCKFVLPENANVEAVSATRQDGVLKVSVKKVPPRIIPVESVAIRGRKHH